MSKWGALMDSMYEESAHWDTGKRKKSEDGESSPKAKWTKDGLQALLGLEAGLERRIEASNGLYDPSVWKEAFARADNEADRKRLRMLIHETTQEAALREHYWVAATKGGPARRVALNVADHSLENVQMCNLSQEREPGLHLRESRYAGTAHFIYADVLDVAVFMKQDQKADPLVLVFGSDQALGGDGPTGGVSQEEYVLRRTNVEWMATNAGHRDIQRTWSYPLPARGGLYVPRAHVLRSNEATGYKFLLHPIRMSFLVAAAPANDSPHHVNSRLSFVEDWRRRIDSVLAIALQKGHDSLVLGAWGCGGQANNCGQVASLFKEALTERFRGCFRHVVFAFLHDPEAFKSFGAVFGAPSMPIPDDEKEQFDRSFLRREQRASRNKLLEEKDAPGKKLEPVVQSPRLIKAVKQVK